jgi:signal transduction histidine kinase
MDISKKQLVETIVGINNDITIDYSYTGLGLTISKNICELMGGNIWFKSENNIGSVFYFNIITSARASTAGAVLLTQSGKATI